MHASGMTSSLYSWKNEAWERGGDLPISHSESVAKVGPEGRSPDLECCIFFHYCVLIYIIGWEMVREMNTERLNNLPRLHGKLLAEPDEFIPYRTPSV